ncbi:MAG: hypothetical protein LBE71_01645 [Dysgonamonadaceae bacterium]|jgi:hypothetical protein|nr:hypothetical protein [Dysgonamonadaceae bacterium]
MDPVSIASGVIGLGSSIFGAINAHREQKKMENLRRQQQADNKSWYNANALGDYTQRADAQMLLRNLRENLSKQNRVAANTAVITGATPEQQAAQKEQANSVITNTYANLGAMGQQYRDKVTDRYLERKSSIEDSQYQTMQGNLNNYSTLFNNSISSLANLASTAAAQKKPALS